MNKYNALLKQVFIATYLDLSSKQTSSTLPPKSLGHPTDSSLHNYPEYEKCSLNKMTLAAVNGHIAACFGRFFSVNWKHQVNFILRITEIVFAFAVMINAALDMTNRNREHLSAASDILVTY